MKLAVENLEPKQNMFGATMKYLEAIFYDLTLHLLGYTNVLS